MKTAGATTVPTVGVAVGQLDGDRVAAAHVLVGQRRLCSVPDSPSESRYARTGTSVSGKVGASRSVLVVNEKPEGPTSTEDGLSVCSYPTGVVVPVSKTSIVTGTSSSTSSPWIVPWT